MTHLSLLPPGEGEGMRVNWFGFWFPSLTHREVLMPQEAGCRERPSESGNPGIQKDKFLRLLLPQGEEVMRAGFKNPEELLRAQSGDREEAGQRGRNPADRFFQTRQDIR